jgi:8-oxo-dGTP diphosphatase
MNKPCVSAIFTNDKGEILLQDHVKLDRYTLPGGKVDPGEKSKDALVREVREELGVTITKAYAVGRANLGKQEYPAHSGNFIHFTQEYFVVQEYSGRITNKEPNKHRDLVWVRPEDFSKLPRDISNALRLAVENNFIN